MKPDPERDTTGQLSRKGSEARQEREPPASAGERAARQRSQDQAERYSSGGSDDIVGVPNSQGGTGGGNLPGPEDR